MCGISKKYGIHPVLFWMDHVFGYGLKYSDPFELTSVSE